MQEPGLATRGTNMYVFRDGRRPVRTAALIDDITRATDTLAATTSGPSGPIAGTAATRALLAAGDLECGLADAGLGAAREAAGLTDLLADAFLGRGDAAAEARRICARLAAMSLPRALAIAPAEGFAYYGLHPLDYAALVAQVASGAPPGELAVVGIRTIGTTLGAVVAAAARRQGLRAWRTSVRPTGPPYQRRTRLSPGDEARVRARAGTDLFLVVDEGPGLSGSSFLSVGEALGDAGVAPGRVVFLCSRPVDPARLVAPDALRRWRRFRALVAPCSGRVPADASVWIGAGLWRARCWRDPAAWPASWTQMERSKLVASDGRRLYKFEGLGAHGDGARGRAATLAEAGFLPAGAGRDAGDGFLEYPIVAGRPASREDLSPQVLARLADYCAFRAEAFPAEPDGAGALLTEMVRVNAAEALGPSAGRALEARATARLEIRRPTITDGRLQPHEWLIGTDGAIYKVDGVGHGDDHFLPGPTDAAWDLAGAIFEWGLGPAASEVLVGRYRGRTGDDPRRRLPGFLAAYALFRAGYFAMAAGAMSGSDEETRLLAACRRCRSRLELISREVT